MQITSDLKRRKVMISEIQIISLIEAIDEGRITEQLMTEELMQIVNDYKSKEMQKLVKDK